METIDGGSKILHGSSMNKYKKVLQRQRMQGEKVNSNTSSGASVSQDLKQGKDSVMRKRKSMDSEA